MNLYEAFQDSVKEHFEQVSILEGENRFTFAQVSKGVSRIESRLLASGIEPGDRVALLAPNSYAFVASFFGILGAGGVVLPLNLMLSPPALLHQIRHSGARFLLTLAAFGKLTDQVKQEIGRLSILDVKEVLETDYPERSPSPRGIEEQAVLMYTSGTTGDPKGVMLSNKNLLANSSSVQEVFRFTKDDHFVCVLPFFHSFALTTELLASQMVGAKLETMPRFHPSEAVKTLDRAGRETRGRVVFPAVASMSALMTRVRGDYELAKNHIYISGGAALPNRVFDDFKNRFGADVLQGYGLTEASPVVAVCRPEGFKKGTIGPPIPGVEIEIQNENGDLRPAGTEGEIMVRGDNVMMGYFQNPEATKDAITPDGRLHTGDLGFIDVEGNVTISGRAKELIISAGENIHPQEIEEVLLDHPKIAETAVLGVADQLKGEVPRAFIVPVSGETLTASEIRSYCAGKLPDFKVPKYFDFLDEIPKLPTGKPDKRKLKQNMGTE